MSSIKKPVTAAPVSMLLARAAWGRTPNTGTTVVLVPPDAVLSSAPGEVQGGSIADHIRAKLVVDALQLAAWRRRPPEGADTPVSTPTRLRGGTGFAIG